MPSRPFTSTCGDLWRNRHTPGYAWLRHLRQDNVGGIHFWPFDGWAFSTGRSAVVEVYPALWVRNFPCDGRDADQHAAYSITAWMRRADLDGNLIGFLNPSLTSEERQIAQVEGWILGVA